MHEAYAQLSIGEKKTRLAVGSICSLSSYTYTAPIEEQQRREKKFEANRTDCIRFRNLL